MVRNMDKSTAENDKNACDKVFHMSFLKSFSAKDLQGFFLECSLYIVVDLIYKNFIYFWKCILANGTVKCIFLIKCLFNHLYK